MQVAPGVHLRVNWPGDRPFTGQVCVAGKDHEILYPGELYFRVEGRADQALHQLLVGYEVELV